MMKKTSVKTVCLLICPVLCAALMAGCAAKPSGSGSNDTQETSAADSQNGKINREDIVSAGLCGDDATWVLENTGTLRIYGTGSTYDYESGTSPFCKNEDIKYVVIEEGITGIGKYVFQDCSKIVSVSLPESLEKTDSTAFEGCDRLDGITGADEKKGTVMEQGTLSDNINWTLDSNGLLVMSGSGEIPAPSDDDTFPDREKITELKIEEGITGIGENAFEHCRNLEVVTLPEGMLSLGKSAFTACFSLYSINLPDSIETIGAHAFEYCDGLEYITLPENITYIDYHVFDGCSLREIVIPDNVLMIRNSFCYNQKLEKVILSDGIKEIGSGAFYECSSLKEIELPDSLEKIDREAFWNCDSLTGITIPASVTEIEEKALGFCGDPESDKPHRTEGFRIYCYKGTAGEKYAVDNKFDYEIIGG